CAMAFDAARARTLLFGGSAVGTPVRYADLYEYDGISWVQRNGAGPGRDASALAYDSVRGRAVLFGGTPFLYPNALTLSDTGEWTGNAWLQAAPAVSPPARRAHALAFDPVRIRVVLFGGVDANGAPLGDTWEWDGSAWLQMSPLLSPPARAVHALAYDPG